VKLCAQHLASTQLQALSFFSCVNKTWQTIPDTWPSCAREVGLDAGELGASLLTASSERSEAMGSPVSPTLFMNDELYNGGRARPFLVQAACRALADVEQAVFPTMRTTTIDSRSAAGRELLASLELTSLPALLFDPAVANAA